MARVCGAAPGPGERLGLAMGTGGGACRWRLLYSEADDPEAPAPPRPPAAEWGRSTLKASLSCE